MVVGVGSGDAGTCGDGRVGSISDHLSCGGNTHHHTAICEDPNEPTMIAFKSIKPGTKFNSLAFRREFATQAERIAPKIHADMKKPTMTWVPPVEFEEQVFVGTRAATEADKSGAGIAILVTTEDNRYRFVDEGTKVRYATMTKNFIPKTRVKSLKAYKGRGGLLFVNKKKPKPGIKARGFTKIVQRKWRPEFTELMREAMRSGATKSGHGVR